MDAIHKSQLKGRKVSFVSEDGRSLIKTVIKISGNTLTVAHKVKVKTTHTWNAECINPATTKIHGVYYRGKLIPIDWSIHRTSSKNQGNQPGGHRLPDNNTLDAPLLTQTGGETHPFSSEDTASIYSQNASPSTTFTTGGEY